MSVKISFFLLLVLSFGSTFAQEHEDQSKSDIETKKKSNAKQLLELLEPYPEAHEEMKKAFKKERFATVISLSGSGLLGYSIGTAIKGKPQWGLTGIGTGLIIVSIPLYISFDKQSQKALEIYEHEVMKPFNLSKVKLDIGKTPHGLGLVLWL